jgi:hypothetical protein
MLIGDFLGRSRVLKCYYIIVRYEVVQVAMSLKSTSEI